MHKKSVQEKRFKLRLNREIFVEVWISDFNGKCYKIVSIASIVWLNVASMQKHIERSGKKSFLEQEHELSRLKPKNMEVFIGWSLWSRF